MFQGSSENFCERRYGAIAESTGTNDTCVFGRAHESGWINYYTAIAEGGTEETRHVSLWSFGKWQNIKPL
mgnify:FL=1